MAHDVFISHSSKDKTIADAVCARLEARGIRCWIAPRDVQPGQPYAEELIDAIQNCRVMVLVLSANANASPHIPKEIERAVSRGVSVIPLRVENVTPAKSLDYFISSVHWLDAITPPLEQHLESLANTVLAILQGVTPAKAEPARVAPAVPAPPAGGAPKKGPPKWMLAASAAVVAVLVAGYFWSRPPAPGEQPAPMVNGPASAIPNAPAPSAAADPITGCWHWYNNATVVISPGGTMQAGPFTARWRVGDAARRVYHFTWPEAVDTLTLSPDGRTLTGGNQYGFSTSALRLSFGPGISGNWRWPNGAIVVVRPDGYFSVANFAGRWRANSPTSYALTWPKPVDTVVVSADFRSLSGSNQYGIPVSANRMGSCGGM